MVFILIFIKNIKLNQTLLAGRHEKTYYEKSDRSKPKKRINQHARKLTEEFGKSNIHKEVSALL